MKFLKLSADRALMLASGGCLALALTLLLSACAGGGSPNDVAWLRAQMAYNDAVRAAIIAREPCVLYGEDAPDCRIPAAAWPRVNAAIEAGAKVVDGVGAGAPGQSTAEALLAVAEQIVASIPVQR